MNLLRIDICCNDPDNGLFDHHAAGIQLQDGLMELAAGDMVGPSFREQGDYIKLSRRHFPIHSSKDWFGNWCWNAYWMEEEAAVDLLAYAHSLGRFGVDQAEERMFARWKDDRPFDARDREFFGRQMIKASLNDQRRQGR